MIWVAPEFSGERPRPIGGGFGGLLRPSGYL